MSKKSSPFQQIVYVVGAFALGYLTCITVDNAQGNWLNDQYSDLISIQENTVNKLTAAYANKVYEYDMAIGEYQTATKMLQDENGLLEEKLKVVSRLIKIFNDKVKEFPNHIIIPKESSKEVHFKG